MHPFPPLPLDEEERLRALYRYRILDTDPDPRFDRIVNIATRRFDVPMAFIGFVDFARQFLKAPAASPVRNLPREESFCAFAILDDEVLVVLDALEDQRFCENPLVVGELGVRFYAGAPLISASGHRVGTICLVDTEPHAGFSDRDREDLNDLASIVVDYLDMGVMVGDVHEEIKVHKAAEAEAQDLAYRDVLTGLPNRAHLQKVVAEGLPFDRQGVLGVLAADLDHFKSVNDTFGHQVGDELLRRTAARIQAILGERSFLARISGDEFVALIDRDSREAIQSLANDIVEATAAPVPLRGRTISHGVSLGVAFAGPRETNIDTLVQSADLALCAAKKAGRRRAAVFDCDMATEAVRWATLKHDLVGALRDGAITVDFQAIHRAADATMVGVEALAGWQHPRLGPVGPAELAAVAEEGGQITALGDYVLRAALNAARRWPSLRWVSVNPSPVQFRLGDLAPGISALLDETGVPGRRLQLEINESMLLDDRASARRQLEALSAIGVRLALDGFGTGHSGLNYLAELPFKAVKIDHASVRAARRDRKRDTVVRHIVALARRLDMTVTAEGVETRDDAILLTAAGCTSLQGEYFGGPMPADAIAARLRAARPAA